MVFKIVVIIFTVYTNHPHLFLIVTLNIPLAKQIISQIPVAMDHLKLDPKQRVISFIIPHVQTQLNA